MACMVLVKLGFLYTDQKQLGQRSIYFSLQYPITAHQQGSQGKESKKARIQRQDCSLLSGSTCFLTTPRSNQLSGGTMQSEGDLPTSIINQEKTTHDNIQANPIVAFAHQRVCQFGIKSAGMAPDHKFTIYNKTPLSVLL